MMDASTISLAKDIAALTKDKSRILVAVCGPPATGKSTFSEALRNALVSDANAMSVVVPMDGFHLDNGQLGHLGLRHRKGAPETFDFDGFASLLGRLRDNTAAIYFPTFDRSLDKSIAGAGIVSSDCQIVIVEGNYLLLNEPPWADLRGLFDHSIYLETSIEVLKSRLIQRWLDHGHTEQEARDRAMKNDIPNAERVCANLVQPDRTLNL